MTKQEAIEQVQIIWTNLKNKFRCESMDDRINKEYLNIFKDKFEALDMAIEALEQQIKIQYCKDCKWCVEWSKGLLCDIDKSTIVETFANNYCSWGEKKELS